MADLEHRYYDFTKEEIDCLEEFKIEWRAADRKKRHAIATEVYQKFRKDSPGWDKKTKELKKRVRVNNSSHCIHCID
jgi:hypothetical protein